MLICQPGERVRLYGRDDVHGTAARVSRASGAGGARALVRWDDERPPTDHALMDLAFAGEPAPFGPTRARALWAQRGFGQSLTGSGMTAAEDAYVRAVWARMAGTACWNDAFLRILWGEELATHAERLAELVVLYRDGNCQLWGIPYPLREDQTPRDLERAGRKPGWVWLGSPGWWGTMPPEAIEQTRAFLAAHAADVPRGLYESGAIVDAPRIT